MRAYFLAPHMRCELPPPPPVACAAEPARRRRLAVPRELGALRDALDALPLAPDFAAAMARVGALLEAARTAGGAAGAPARSELVAAARAAATGRRRDEWRFSGAAASLGVMLQSFE